MMIRPPDVLFLTFLGYIILYLVYTEMTAKLEATNEIDVDDAVTATAPLYRYEGTIVS